MAPNTTSVQTFVTNGKFFRVGSTTIMSLELNYTIQNLNDVPLGSPVQVIMQTETNAGIVTKIQTTDGVLNTQSGKFSLSITEPTTLKDAFPLDAMNVKVFMWLKPNLIAITSQIGLSLQVSGTTPTNSMVTLDLVNLEFKDDRLLGTIKATKTTNFDSAFTNTNINLLIQILNESGAVMFIKNNFFNFGTESIVNIGVDETFTNSQLDVNAFLFNPIGNIPFANTVNRILQNQTTQPPPPPPPPPPPILDNIQFTINYNDGTSQQYITTRPDSVIIDNLPLDTRWFKSFFVDIDSPITATAQQVIDAINIKIASLPPVPTDTVNPMMVSQSIGAFKIENNRLTGEILYIANQEFNPFWYGKPITSFVQIKDLNNFVIEIKSNNLVFTETERDERLFFDILLANNKTVKVDIFVFVSDVDTRRFADDKTFQVTEGAPPPPPPPPIPQKADGVISLLKGMLFGSIALSLLGSKK